MAHSFLFCGLVRKDEDRDADKKENKKEQKKEDQIIAIRISVNIGSKDCFSKCCWCSSSRKQRATNVWAVVTRIYSLDTPPYWCKVCSCFVFGVSYVRVSTIQIL